MKPMIPTSHRSPRTTLLALAALALLASFGCRKVVKVMEPPELAVYPPPFLPIPAARATIVPRSQFMKVAVLNAVDQTGRSGNLVEVLADGISTELHRSGRFEVYDRGHLRHYDFDQVLDRCYKPGGACVDVRRGSGDYAVVPSPEKKDAYVHHLETLQNQSNAIRRATDALLLLAITTTSGGRALVDFRLVNSVSYTVMVAGSAEVGWSGGAGLKVDRGHIRRLANEIRNGLPKPDPGRIGEIRVQDGKVLTISLGRKDGIIAGMNVFVTAAGRGAGTSAASANTVDEMYLAQAYVVSVYENTSQVVVFDGEDYRVGDSVRFK